MGMTDTHFVLPPKKRCRAASLYDAIKLGRKRQREANGTPYLLKPYHHRDATPGIFSGSGGITSYNDGGMWSTAKDYAKFCQMLVAGGIAPNGRQILKASTVKSLW